MAAGDLTTLDAVKAYLNIQGTASDGVLTRLISQCSFAVGNFLNRNLLTQSYTESYDGNDSAALMLRQTPVTAVSALTVNGTAVQASSDGIYRDGFAFDSNRLIMINRRFSRGMQNIRVTYTAGYASIPGDVEEAVIEFVSDRYRMISRIGEQSKAIPEGGSVSYDMSYMSKKVQGSLSNYRRMIPI